MAFNSLQLLADWCDLSSSDWITAQVGCRRRQQLFLGLLFLCTFFRSQVCLAEWTSPELSGVVNRGQRLNYGVRSSDGCYIPLNAVSNFQVFVRG